MLNTPAIATSTLLLIFALLFYPLAATLSPTPRPPTWALTHVKTAVKFSFFLSLIPLSLHLSQGTEEVTTICT